MRRQRPEDIEQNNIKTFVRSIGGWPCVLGTRRRRGDYHGTMQTEGLPDLWLFLPAVVASERYQLHNKPPLALWWEAKAPGQKRSPDQVKFGDWCDQTNTPYGWGTENDFLHWLIEHGRLSPKQIAHYRQPAARHEATPQ